MAEKEEKPKGSIVRHPAKYSDCLMPIFDKLLPVEGKILDCFAGTGKLRLIRPNATLLEIEPEWAEMNNAIVGDATKMPFGNEEFEAVCTSPTYGNRMADHFIDHKTEKHYKRNTYTHCLGHKLSPNNSGAMYFGEAYKDLHKKAWQEVFRVLKNGGVFILNISNHIRFGKEIKVSEWHRDYIKSLGFVLKKEIKVKTPRNKFGANSNKRVDSENVYVFQKFTFGGK